MWAPHDPTRHFSSLHEDLRGLRWSTHAPPTYTVFTANIPHWTSSRSAELKFTQFRKMFILNNNNWGCFGVWKVTLLVWIRCSRGIKLALALAWWLTRPICRIWINSVAQHFKRHTLCFVAVFCKAGLLQQKQPWRMHWWAELSELCRF